MCGEPLTLEAGWHIHHLLWRSHGGSDPVDNRVVLQPNCHRQMYSERLAVNEAASREGRSRRLERRASKGACAVPG